MADQASPKRFTRVVTEVIDTETETSIYTHTTGAAKGIESGLNDGRIDPDDLVWGEIGRLS